MKAFTVGVFLGLSIFVSRVEAQKALDPFKKDNLFGRIKLITETDYIDKGKSGGSAGADSLTKNVIKYDSAGNITERIYCSKGKNDQFQFNTRFVYQRKADAGDSIIMELYTNEKQADLYFDRKGNIIKFSAYGDKGAFWYKNIYKYNRRGYQIKDEEYDKKGNLVFVTESKYNNAGFIMEQKNNTANRSGIKIHYTYTAFDEAGNWVKRVKIPELDNGTLSQPFYTERKIVYYQ
jgi:hypothetical protein